MKDYLLRLLHKERMKFLGYALKTTCNKCGHVSIGGLTFCKLYCEKCKSKKVTISKSKEHPVYGDEVCS